MATPQLQPLPPSAVLNQMLMSGTVVQAITVMAELGVADALADGPRTSVEIAQAVGANPDALYRIMRALSGTGMLNELEGGRFALTPLSECLRSGVPGSMRAWARMLGAEWNRRVGTQMVHAARTGEEVVARALGQPIWEYFAQNKH